PAGWSEDSPHGMESSGACRRPRAVQRNPFGLTLLLRPLVLSGCSEGREAGLDRGWPDSGAGGSGRAVRGYCCAMGGSSDRVVRVRRAVRGGDRGGSDSRDTVSSGEEPGVGHSHAGELRRHREGRPVIVIPAIDLREGRCVRLHQGRRDRGTGFSDDPVAVARGWKELGAERLHVVDLDGAFAGEPKQTALVGKIVAAVAPVPVEVGGGLRDLRAVESALDTGVAWAVVGTRAALDRVFLSEICRLHPGRIIVAVDARGARVAIKGWTEVVEETVAEVGARARNAGAAALLYTDVSRDGTETGPNVEETENLARRVALPILASGGVGRVDDLKRLAAIPGVVGAVVGRALYTGAIDLREAAAAAGAGAREACSPSASFPLST